MWGCGPSQRLGIVNDELSGSSLRKPGLQVLRQFNLLVRSELPRKGSSPDLGW
jgi:hypothetical protein